MSAYYNEFDKGAAAWLRELIKRGLIAPGDVDERSIVDVRPDDLAGYRQCHFFAGIGGWSYALRLAGWPDDRPVWTGSCPCQPFSAAGKREGFADDRHLWPVWFGLISERQPATVFGEQVASKDADPWIDLVHADMEGMGYAFGCVPFPSAGVGAPHIRDRNYWVANANGWNASAEREQRSGQQRQQPADSCAGRMAHANGGQQQGVTVLRGNERNGPDAGWPQGGGGVAACGEHVGLADTEIVRRQRKHLHEGGRLPPLGAADSRGDNWASPLHGFWRSADWLACTDGKWRPVEPGTFPLAHGIPGRVGRLRAYGNAIVPQVAAEFISAFLDVTEQT